MSISNLLNNPIVLNTLTTSINSNVLTTLNQQRDQIDNLLSANSINYNTAQQVQTHAVKLQNINNFVGNYYILTCQSFNDTTLSAIQQNLTTTFYNNLTKLNFIVRINLTLYNTSTTPFQSTDIIAKMNNQLIKYIYVPTIPINGYYTINVICKDGTQLIPTSNNNITLSFLPNTPIQILNYSVEVGTLNILTLN
jgi:hypothetical protein